MNPQPSQWSSIMKMLKQNKCWLCQETFHRGKTKKVFQIFHVLNYFESLEQNGADRTVQVKGRDILMDSNDKNIDPNGIEIESTECYESLFISENLRACYLEFITCGGASNMDGIVDRMKSSCDLDTWMSGLICSTNDNCLIEYQALVPESNSLLDGSSMGSAKKVDDKICTPGCACDNPWAFIN